MRKVLTALAGAALASCIAPVPVSAQTADVPVRLAEIARQDIFLPLYGALGKGLFRREGLRVTSKVTLGPDQTLAALLNGDADIGLGGPDIAINSAINAHGENIKIIAAICRFEGSFLVAQDPHAQPFRWDMLKGRSLMGWRSGTFPSVFLESALRHEKIDPRTDIRYRPNVPYPARMQLWRARRVDFATFYLVDAARLEREKAGYAVASVGEAAGPSVYTVFLATAAYIRDHPETIRKWANAIQAALRWTATAPVEELAAVAARYLPRAEPADLATAFRRYRPLGIWQTDPTVGPEAIDRVQDMLIESGVMAPRRRVKYETVVAPGFAESAKRAAPR
jgi:NitT/TauT family transport system substrate-binding protein